MQKMSDPILDLGRRRISAMIKGRAAIGAQSCKGNPLRGRLRRP
jgi:hypothetical protein